MPIDPNISPSAVSDYERAAIERYGFDVKSDNGHFVLYDPERKHIKRGKYGPGGNLGLLLTAAIRNRENTAKELADLEHSLPAPKNLKGGKTRKSSNTAPTAAESKDAAPVARDAPVHDVDDVLSPVARLSNGADVTVTRTVDGYRIHDPVVAKYYAFRDASKKGIYRGPDLDELLVQAREVHDGMLADKNGVKAPKAPKTAVKAPAELPAPKQAAPRKANTREAAPSSDKPKAPRVKKDNRFTRAFRVLLANPDLSVEQVAKQTHLSSSMAKICCERWTIAKQVFSAPATEGEPLIGIDDKTTVRAFKWLKYDPNLSAETLAENISIAARTAYYLIEAWSAAVSMLSS